MVSRLTYAISMEQSWAKIIPNLDVLFNIKEIPRRPTYIRLYGSVFEYCQIKVPQGMVIKSSLYLKLKVYLTSYCNDLIQKSADLMDEDLLRFYTTEWKMYERNSKILNGAFERVNKSWERMDLQKIYDNPEAVMVGSMAIITWKDTVFQKYDTRIVNIVLKLIDRQRHGEIIDTSIIQRFASSYVTMGIYVDGENTNLILYQERFEKQFLESAENFYILESLAFLNDNPVTAYLKRVEKRLREEAIKVAPYVDRSSKHKLDKIVERSLIQNHLEEFAVEFQELLKLDKNDDMKLLYSLVNRNPEDLDKFIELFQKHVHSQGLLSIEKRGEAVKSDSNMFMDAILNVHKKYLNLVSTEFDNNVRFTEAFHTACKDFVNLNFTSTGSNTSRKPSELLAKYCDNLLKKSNSSKTKDMDKAQEDVMTVFKFILDKDVFQTSYMKSLGRRLINQTSYNEDCETEMILKLKENIGAQFTSKFERMLSDVTVSMDISKQFDQSDTKSHKFDFNMMVLQFGSWPMYSTLTYTLPSELEKCMSEFYIFYTSKYAGKTLNWKYNLSKGEVGTTNFKKRYIFQSSNMQIAILMLFNTSTTLSLAQIHERSAIEMESIKQIVQILLKTKIVTSDQDVGDLTPDTMVSVNKAYNNKKQRVNINIPIKEDVQREQEVEDKNIDGSRKFVIQAAIVRIMKTRKILKHSELVSEVIQSLSEKFQPNIAMIKQAMELLIQKDYIERDGKEGVYTYLA